MNRDEAADVAAEALELASDGRWGELLGLELPGSVVELVRRKQQLNIQVGNLEEQERVLWELIIQLLMDGDS